MENVTARAIPNADAAIRRELLERIERLRWAHHVADAATGKVLTTQLRQPVSPLARAKRLSKLDHQFDPAIFGTPTYRLTARYPYQTSPKSYLEFFRTLVLTPLGIGTIVPEGFAFWSAEDIVDERLRMSAGLLEPLQGPCLLSLDLIILHEPGQVGRINIYVTEPDTVLASFRLAVHGDEPRLHTIDIVFMPGPNPTYTVSMTFEPGLKKVWFLSLTVAPQHPIVDMGL